MVQNEITQIEQAKQEWEATVDSLPQLVCLLDDQQRIIRANRTVERWGLANVSEVKGMKFADLLHVNRPGAANYLKLLLNQAWEQIAQGHAVEYEFEDRILHRYLHIQIRPTASQSDKILSSFAAIVIHDVTKQKQLEKALQKANEELAKLNADKDKFFSILAHDLRGPFTPLLGNAELLVTMAEKLSPKEVKAFGESIHQSGRRIFELLENLLTWAMMQMGRMVYEPQFFDLQDIVEKNSGLLTEMAQRKQITLTTVLMEGADVYADANMINTVIRNLMTNALKFTPVGGQVTVTCQMRVDEFTHIAEFLEVSVVDTGVGISAEDMTKLLRLDVHHSTTGTAKEKGTGLGLIMCKEMVERNFGNIWLESVLGQGTRVKFTLPLTPPMEIDNESQYIKI